MSGLEQAIRNALSRAESSNPEIRARIYQSARNALETGLRKQEINDPEAIAAQRHRLEMTIRQIETEQRQATRAERPGTGAPAAGAAAPVASGEDRPEPRPVRAAVDENAPGAALEEIRPERGDGFGPAAPASKRAGRAVQDDGLVAASPRMAKAPKRRGRLFSFLLVMTTLAAAIGTAFWWVQSSGLLLPPGERDGRVANPSQTVRGEDFGGPDPVKEALDAQNSFSADWREVFGPGRTDGLSAGPKSRFESVSTDEGPAVRLVSSAADREGAVAIAVEPDVLRAMAGKTSTIAITVEPENGKPVQVAVECEFSALGDCDRHRFAVTDRADLLFQVAFDRTLSPNEPGRLFIHSDVNGGGAGINLFAVRILPGE